MIEINPKRQILCPVCRRATAVRINTDTVLKKFPLYCSWCKQEFIISNGNE